MVEKKKNTLVEITEKEFVNQIFDNADYYEEKINDLKKSQSAFYKLYREYCYDKSEYRLSFFIENDSRLFYTKTPYEIGFKRKGEQK